MCIYVYIYVYIYICIEKHVYHLNRVSAYVFKFEIVVKYSRDFRVYKTSTFFV